MKKYVFLLATALATLAVAQNVTPVQVNGVVSGFGSTQSGLVDGAMVLPTLSNDDILQFQMSQFIGPNQKMTVGGLFSAQVPANFDFPNQTHWDGIFPVNFGKPQFTISVVPGDQRELVAAWFQLPFDQMIQMQQSSSPPTAMLPLINIQQYAYATEEDWSTVPSISLTLDVPQVTGIDYSWTRDAVTGTDMDSVFLFQATPTNRWAFANLQGNPSGPQSLAAMSGLLNTFKVLFMRVHNDSNNQVNAAEGYIRPSDGTSTVSVDGVPVPLQATMDASYNISWTPIQDWGWMTLNISPKNSSGPSVQYWLDPTVGNANSLKLDPTLLQNSDVMLAFIGTSVQVQMPAQGQDNTAFANAASEIRMNELN